MKFCHDVKPALLLAVAVSGQRAQKKKKMLANMKLIRSPLPFKANCTSVFDAYCSNS